MSNFKFFPQLFLETYLRVSNFKAISYDGKEYTYEDLHKKSNQVANYLLSIGVGVDSVVALAFDRSFDMVASMIGILKSGAAFVPLDVNYPELRTKHILEDSKALTVITKQKYFKGLQEVCKNVVAIEELASVSDDSVEVTILGQQLAYIIYTSGSTGKPKGVCVSHGNLVNVFNTFESIYAFSSGEAFIPNSSINFDPSLWQLLMPLLSGGILILLDEQDLYRADVLTTKIKEWSVKLFHAVPSVLWTLLQHKDFLEIDSLSAILGGGEMWSKETLALIKENLLQTRLINVYGPTEATIHVTSWGKQASDLPLSIPIGKAIENNKIYILNKNLQPVPVGVPGEIFVAGDNVARGYLEQPVFTADKFIANPFVSEDDVNQLKNLRMYKTGDLGKYLVDGNIQFLGRSDNQVKIRGFRIEISEIESCLIHPLLSKNTVLVKVDGTNKNLVAYVVPKYRSKYYSKESFVYLNKEIKIYSGIEVNELIVILKKQLLEFLPEYMVPTEFFVISDVPLSISGKTDNNWLLALEPADKGDISETIPPQTIIQQELCTIWRDVLGRTNIGIYDNFFKVGGNSLLAMQMLARVRNKLNVYVQLNIIFKSPTIAQLSEFIENHKTMVLNELPSISDVSLPPFVPLSFSQQRLWLITKLFPNVALYNIPISIELTGHLNYVALEEAIIKIIERHESFRTNFLEDKNGFAMQNISIQNKFSLDKNTICLQNEDDIQSIMYAESNYIFDLEKDELFRVKLVWLSEHRHILLFNIHHIISDGWSVQILLKDLSKLYNDGACYLQPLPFNYTHYSVWQKSWLKDEILNRQLSYWTEHLANIPEFINLPYDYARPAELKYFGEKILFSLSKERANDLTALAHEKNASLFMIILAALQCLLYKYSQQSDVVIGTPVANRHYPGSEEIIGFFVNTLALRAKLNVEDSFEEILSRAIDSTLSGYEHQDLPFEQLVENLQIERNLNINPVFQIMLLVSKERDNYVPELKGLQINFIQNKYDVAKFDLTFSITERCDGAIDVMILYASEIFAQESICRMADHFEHILFQVVSSPKIKLKEIELVTQNEKSQILLEWNSTDKVFGSHKTLHALFESQVHMTPNNIAAVYSGQTITYSLLNKKSNQLARILSSKGVGPDVLVAVVMNKSIDILVGLLAILKAGGAYVPIDPSYPIERLKILLSDIKSNILLTQSDIVSKCKEVFNNDLICVDSEMQENVNIDSENLNVAIHPNNLAYIIYTSGSTGRPKGVSIEHRSCINTIYDINNKHNVTEKDRSIMLSNYNFDLSVYDIFGLLGVGGAVIIPTDEEVKDPCNYCNIILKQNVTIWNSVPAFMQLWVNSLNETDDIPENLRLVMLSGDKIPLDLPEKIQRKSLNPTLRVFSLGGATEASIWSIDYLIQDVDTDWESIPYGKPLANQQFYVLDEFYSLCPVGVMGHLYIGGLGLARNYFNQPDLTADRFIANPFVDNNSPVYFSNLRLYKTGDLGKYLPDGNIEFLGRSDSQVKIRGFRIELGEIEKNLVDPLVSESIVLARNDFQGKVLVAYIVPQEIEKFQVSKNENTNLNAEVNIIIGPQSESLIAYLQNKLYHKLPDYMIPSEFVLVNKIPLTVNAKVDSKALLLLSSYKEKIDYLPPTNKLQEDICLIWKEVLGASRVGISDNFFKIGGHSLLAANVMAKIRDRMGVNLSLKAIFNNPTIAKLTAFIQVNHNEYSPVVGGMANITMPSEVPLSFAQQRLWVINKLFPSIALYNIPVTLKMNGKLNYVALERSMQLLIKKHAAFRTNFIELDDDNIYQNIIEHRDFHLNEHTIKCNGEYLDSLSSESNYIFDLQKDMLVRVKLLCLSEEEHILLFNFHHIVSDGWSVQLFLKELSNLYNAISNNSIIGYEKLSIDYGHYSVWQRSWLTTDILDNQLSYWREHLRNIPELINLPYDYVRPKEMKYSGARHNTYLSSDVAKQILNLSQSSQASLFMLMLAALQCLLQKHTQQDNIVIGTPAANRHHPGTANLIGLFVNTLAMRGTIRANSTFAEILAAAREVTLSNYEHQDLPFEQLVDHLSIARNININPIFQVMLLVNSASETVVPDFNNLHVSYLDSEYEVAKFDLTFSVSEKNDGLEISILYSTELFTHDTIKNLGNHFKQLLQQVSVNPNLKLQDINILTGIEEKQLLVDWNNTKKQYPIKTIHSLFEKQVFRTPNNIAAIFDDTEISYKELNAKANRLANALRSYGIGLDVPVGLIVDRSIEMLVAILAVLKAGGAYVPLDPDFPANRLKSILLEINSKVLLTHSKLGDKCKDVFGHHIVYIDEELQKVVGDVLEENINLNINQNNLAYVIYTSGSTGAPKGVAIDHAGLVNRILWMQEQYKLHASDKVLHKTPLTFDVSGWELHWPIIIGATMVIAKPGVHKDAVLLGDLIVKKNVTVIHFVPTMLEAMLSIDIKDKFKNIRMLFASGEALPVNLYRTIKDILGLSVHNLYGPTEASIDVTYNNNDQPFISTIPIGKPIANIKIYILDNYLNPVPIGVAGQIFIQGIGLARGYIQRPDLTAERFIANPFLNRAAFSNEDLRLYKTGDLARWLQSGDIEYIGRIDSQVKVRGFRIELGEIEQAIINTTLVHSCAMQAFIHPILKNVYLEAFVVPKADSLKIEALADNMDEPIIVYQGHAIEQFSMLIKKNLEQCLPDYMVPAHITVIDKLPSNANGKLDSKLLQQYSASNTKHIPYEGIRANNEFEIKVSEVWGEVLKLNDLHFNVTADFFKSGGDSILAIRLVAKLNNVFNVQIQVKDIFILKTIRAIASAISNGEFSFKTDIVSNTSFAVFNNLDKNIQEMYPASYLQAGMLLAGNVSNNHTYHDVFSYSILHKFDESKFMKVWNALINKHSMLRAAFLSSNNAWDVCVYKFIKVQYSYHSNSNIEDIIKHERNNEFNYAEPGLFRLLVNDNLNGFDFILSFHHAIADGWSIASLLNEFLIAYVNNSEVLGVEQLRYSEYVRNEITAINDENINNFWLDYLCNVELTSLRSNCGLSSGKDGLHIARYELDYDSVHIVNKLQQENNISSDCIFLLAYINTLRRFTAMNTVTIGLVTNNRIEKESGDELFGMFLNVIPMKLNVGINTTLKSIFDEKVMLKKYQHLPYGHIRSSLNKDVFECAFNYINFHVLRDSEQHIEDIEAIERTSIPFMMHVSERSKESYAIRLVAHDDYVSKKMLDRFLNYLRISLDEVLRGEMDHGNTIIANDLEVINATNSTGSVFPYDNTIHEIFENIAYKYHERIALTDDQNLYSYGELNATANNLARQIIANFSNKIEPVVALMLDRNADIIIAILAILKSGATYLPLDPSNPIEKSKQIIDIAKPDLIICHEAYKSELNQYNALLINGASKGLSSANLGIVTNPNNLAYILFTSGTTGIPKGVGVSHKSVINLINDLRNIYDLSEGKNIAAFSSYTFDVSVSEFFSALLQGGSLHILSDEDRHDPTLLQKTLIRREINYVYIPPAMLSILPVATYSDLKSIIYAGEPCPKDIAFRWSNKLRLYNFYGPTEATIYATGRKIEKSEVHLIGKPVANTTCYVLDKNLSLVPVGAIGELYIGGVGVARGYLYSPDLTAERFIANPFISNDGKNLKNNLRLYKTGDLVKITDEGELEYLGRSDNQIKIRGFRVELEEIEVHLRNTKLVANAKVLYINDHIRAFIITKDRGNLNNQQVIEQINGAILHLPPHMRPTQYVLLDEIPTNPSGKIDVSLLKNMLPENVAITSKNIELRCPIERVVSEEFKFILGISNFDRQDSFFAIGGNSILAAKLSYRVNTAFDTNIKVSDIYVNKNIVNIAKFIKFNTDEKNNLIKLNACLSDDDLYMIHPGGVGCEVYSDLADVLTNKFNCYGIDSYNMYAKETITNVEKLAKLYLSYIDAHRSKAKSEGAYNILGWSLGGYISLEIARQLEARGIDNIRVILLDTVWMYGSSSPLLDDIKFNAFEEEIITNLKHRFFSEGFDKYYVDNRIALTKAELKLSRHLLNNKLKNTKVLLFKAMLEDKRVQTITVNAVNKYTTQCKNNNIEYFINDLSQLNTVILDNADHSSILDNLLPLLENIEIFLCLEEIHEI